MQKGDKMEYIYSLPFRIFVLLPAVIFYGAVNAVYALYITIFGDIEPR